MRAVEIAADISREDQVNAMFAETLHRFGKLDILINNAIVERPAPTQDTTLEAVIDVNLTGQFLCSREAVRAFLNHNVHDRTSGDAPKGMSFRSLAIFSSLDQASWLIGVRIAPGATEFTRIFIGASS